MRDPDEISLPGLSWKANPVVAAVSRLALAPGMRSCEGLIFTATTGRSGTTTLAKVLSLIEGCRTFHEPWPFMNGHRLVNMPIEGDEYSRRMYYWRKALWIRRLARGCRYYVEASHLFIKSFCRYVFDDFGSKAKVIHLVRDPELVAGSMVSLGTIPGNAAASPWYCDPESSNNILPFPVGDEANALASNALARCLWYCYEIEARTAHWRNKAPHITFVDFHIEDLECLDLVTDMTLHLGLQASRQALEQGTTTRLNRKQSRKNEIGTAKVDSSATRDIHLAFRDWLASTGRELPVFFDRYLK